MKNISELRQDIVTGDWVVVATGRARRPDDFARLDRPKEKPQPRKNCPFEKLMPNALVVYDRAGERFQITSKDKAYLENNWWLQVVPNKYPAFGQGVCAVEKRFGPYRMQDGVGFHEVVVTRDHTRSIGRMTNIEVSMAVRSYRNRYLALKDQPCVEYISIFHNHGRESGATISHPHSQIIAIPVIPPDIGRSLRGSAEFHRRNKKCIHCLMLDFELKDKKRIIHKNRSFVAFAPFVSRQAFEIRIFPRRHNPEFDKISDREITDAAEALRLALAKLDRALGDPAYNFFIHTAPTANGKRAGHYHWHIEILPKTGVWAGFEIGTGIEISTVAPEKAAAYLRRVKA